MKGKGYTKPNKTGGKRVLSKTKENKEGTLFLKMLCLHPE